MVSATYKRGDTSPPLKRQLTRNGSPVDLTNARVSLFAEKRDESSLVLFERADILNRDEAVVQIDWPDPLDFSPGVYEVEWVITYDDGGRQTIPTVAFDTLEITEAAHE